jgi:uncharacterized protein
MLNLWERPFSFIENCSSPVFRQDLPEMSLFYAPGYLAVTKPDHAAELDRQLRLPSPSLPAANRLLEHARAAQERWESLFRPKPFTPLCLTLYTSRRCNLRCSYCFSQGETPAADPDLDLPFIRAAAAAVAANCQTAGVPFTLVIHGGGEPTLDLRLPQILSAVDEVAGRYGLACFHYLATNGVMPSEQARWVVQHFDEIGLSCDGPVEIQAAQRPLKDGSSSAPQVEQTAAILRAAGKPLHVRATITPQTLERMPEIAAYLCGSLGAAEVRIEPVFQGGRTLPDDGIAAQEAVRFCAAFFQARRVAAEYGASWASSGSRPGEIHGPYCQVFRDVLHLVPGNGISACFKTGGRSQAQTLGLEIGTSSDSFEVDSNRVRELQQMLAAEVPACERCVNRFHCARGCPDRCSMDPHPEAGRLRCAVNRMLTAALLQEQADRLMPALRHHPIAGSLIQGELC